MLPKLPKEDAIPYVHPPFVAGSLRLLTKVPYDVAVLIWMVITLATVQQRRVVGAIHLS
jgi:hypothetical protein